MFQEEKKSKLENTIHKLSASYVKMYNQEKSDQEVNLSWNVKVINRKIDRRII